MSGLRVLVACERSGVVRQAFRDLGHDAWSCDIESADDGSAFHLKGDVREFLPGYRRYERWDLLIAHPPCTRLANSGVLRLYIGGRKSGGINPQMWRDMEEGAAFFRELWCAPIAFKCLENPVMHGHGQRAIGLLPRPQTVQPYEFGNDASKRTCLWLQNLPPLKRSPQLRYPGRWVTVGTGINATRQERWSNQTDSGQNRLPPSPTRQKERSQTYPGIACAMASQWGEFLTKGSLLRAG